MSAICGMLAAGGGGGGEGAEGAQRRGRTKQEFN